MNYQEYTVKEFVTAYRDLAISFNTTHLKSINDVNDTRIILMSDNLLDKYRGDLKSYEIFLKLSKDEEKKFFYNPKFLSYELYGTTELWHAILDLNEIYSASQFSMNPLKVYDGGILTAITEILNLERDVIDNNNNDIITAANAPLNNY